MVVMKTVGSTMTSATPMQKTVKRSAATTAINRAATSEKVKTVMEKTMKRRSGRPVRVTLARRKAWRVIISL